MPAVTEKPGEEYCLRDVLQKWGLDDTYWKNMSSRWRCTVVPTHEKDEDARDCLLEGNPCFLNTKYAAKVHAACGDDGVDLITKGTGNELKRPKLAFNSSWGKPGAELIHEDHLVPIKKFSEVFDHDAPNPRNLQMFHREGKDEPDIPILPELLQWPQFLEEGSLKMDKATRLSQRNALTTWHLDDCGEFVLQTALKRNPGKDRKQSLKGIHGGTVVKMFFITSKASYDIITQDQEQNRNAVFAQLDLWNTPSEHLPEELPLVRVALVEAGGHPLILYPNLPHTVLTVEDSCLVEERRLHISFLDEVVYFQMRSRQSTSPPIMYHWVREDCTRPETTTDVFEALQFYMQKYPKMRTRSLVSMYALLNDDLFTLDPKTKLAICMQPEKQDAISQDTALVIDAIKHQVYGVFKLPSAEPRYMAYGHVKGAPVFGPTRKTLAHAMSDRKLFAADLDFLDRGSERIAEVIAAVRANAEVAVSAPAIGEEEKKALLDDLF